MGTDARAYTCDVYRVGARLRFSAPGRTYVPVAQDFPLRTAVVAPAAEAGKVHACMHAAASAAGTATKQRCLRMHVCTEEES